MLLIGNIRICVHYRTVNLFLQGVLTDSASSSSKPSHSAEPALGGAGTRSPEGKVQRDLCARLSTITPVRKLRTVCREDLPRVWGEPLAGTRGTQAEPLLLQMSPASQTPTEFLQDAIDTPAPRFQPSPQPHWLLEAWLCLPTGVLLRLFRFSGPSWK